MLIPPFMMKLYVKNEDFTASRDISRTDGLLVGISRALCGLPLNGKASRKRRKVIVAILPDTGRKIISTPLFRVTS